MLGYHRVMIYKFHEDWHGEVVAESRQGKRVRYLGLHYPATDIPQQAHDRYLSDRIRLISDVDSTPVPLLFTAGCTPAATLNLTGCSALAVSPVQLQHLRYIAITPSLSPRWYACISTPSPADSNLSRRPSYETTFCTQGSNSMAIIPQRKLFPLWQIP